MARGSSSARRASFRGIQSDDGEQPGHGQQLPIAPGDVLKFQPATRPPHVQVGLRDSAEAAAIDVRYIRKIQHQANAAGMKMLTDSVFQVRLVLDSEALSWFQHDDIGEDVLD